MLNNHLSGCCKHQHFYNCLRGVAAEHLYKLHTYDQRQGVCQKLCKKVNIHVHKRSLCDRIDQPYASQRDHDQNDDRKHDFCIAGNIVDSLVEVLTYLVIYLLVHKPSLN